jgi:hypothetical protein
MSWKMREVYAPVIMKFPAEYVGWDEMGCIEEQSVDGRGYAHVRCVNKMSGLP